MSKRANRRHHKERILNKWKKLFGVVWSTSTEDTEEEITQWARYCAGRGSLSCGCWMCANERTLEGDTIQERKFAMSANEQERELYEIDEGDH